VVIGGLLVDGRRFDWVSSGKFPTLPEPYEGFHGMVFTDESTAIAFLLRARREGLRDFGACMAPMTAFQVLQGIETLALRMPRHVQSTATVAAYLAANEAVERVNHPSLASHPDAALAARLYPNGCSAILSFELKGGREAGRKFIEALSLFSHLANIGDAKSLVIHPASTTHFRMDDAALVAAGIGPGTVRLSIGLEHPDDLIDDLGRAIYASQK
jgi:O-acetylhomoserine (thiol)-lyase